MEASQSKRVRWDGCRRMTLNIGGTTIETTLQTLCALGSARFFVDQSPGEEAIFLDYPFEIWNTLYRALLVARGGPAGGNVALAVRSLYRAILSSEDDDCHILKSLLDFVGLHWLLGTDYLSDGISDVVHRNEGVLNLFFMPSDYNHVALDTLERLSGEPPHRPLPAGVLAFLKCQTCAAEVDECDRVPVNGLDEDGHPTTEYREGIRKMQILKFDSVIVAEPSSLCTKEDGLRFIVDLGEAYCLVLNSFMVVVHVGGNVPWGFNRNVAMCPKMRG